VAHEAPAGRLAGFEDVKEPDLTFTMPKRAQDPVEPKTVAPRKRAQPKPATGQKPSSTGQNPSTRRSGPKVKRADTSRARPSNVHIPAALLTRVVKARQERGLSAGALIVAAIEATYKDLPRLVKPAPTAGGNLFAVRSSRPSRAGEGALTPLNFRLREQDFATLDRVVGEVGASSRSRLITVALTAHLVVGKG